MSETKAILELATKQTKAAAKRFMNEPDVLKAAIGLVEDNQRIIGGIMNLDFSHFYQEKTFDIKNGETVLFQLVATQIATGASAQIQNKAFSHVDMEKVTAKTKKGRQKQVQKQINAAMKEINGGELAIRETLCGVKSWTLTDAKGNLAPVEYEVFIQLPKFITKQIELAVEELNPEQDESFPGDDGDTGE